MNTYMIIFDDGTTRIIQQDSIASIAFMIDDIEWNYVIAVIKID